MKITKEFLKEKDACNEGFRWFCDNFPEGGEYQVVLDALAKENRADWARWLIEKVGPANTTLEIETMETETSLFFAGKIIVKGALKVDKWLLAGYGIEAGCGIEAGLGIKAGSGIKAGEGIEAGCGIKAGYDFGIFAGLRVRISQRKHCAIITAKKEPKNIICGEFVKREGESNEPSTS